MNQHWKAVVMVIDDYAGKRNEKVQVDSPSLFQVQQAVASLNGGNRSSMCVMGIDESVLCIGGGPDLYHVSVTFADRVMVLTDNQRDQSEISFIIGAITTRLPAHLIVERKLALDAVEYYFSNGGLASTPCEWREC